MAKPETQQALWKGLVDKARLNRLSKIEIVRFGKKANHGVFCDQNEGLKRRGYAQESGTEEEAQDQGIGV